MSRSARSSDIAGSIIRPMGPYRFDRATAPVLPPTRGRPSLRAAVARVAAPVGLARGAPSRAIARRDGRRHPARESVGLAAGSTRPGDTWTRSDGSGSATWCAGRSRGRPASGNDKPRIVRNPERASMVNAMGLPNPGAEAAARALGRTKPRGPRVASVADQDLPDVLETHAMMEPFVDAVELNASCPNVAWGRGPRQRGPPREPGAGARHPPVASVVRQAPAVPNRGGARGGACARRDREEEGADGLTVSNTPPGAGPAPVRRAWRALGQRRARGDAGLRPRRSRGDGPGMPINASGGILTPADAFEAIEAGATTVQVYTGLVFGGPGIVGELTRGSRRRSGPAGSNSPRSWGPPEPNRGVACPGPVPVQDDAIPNGIEHPEVGLTQRATGRIRHLSGAPGVRGHPRRGRQAVRGRRRRGRRRSGGPRGRVLLDARSVGVREDDLPADDRGVRGPHRGQRAARW